MNKIDKILSKVHSTTESGFTNDPASWGIFVKGWNKIEINQSSGYRDKFGNWQKGHDIVSRIKGRADIGLRKGTDLIEYGLKYILSKKSELYDKTPTAKQDICINFTKSKLKILYEVDFKEMSIIVTSVLADHMSITDEVKILNVNENQAIDDSTIETVMVRDIDINQ